MARQKHRLRLMTTLTPEELRYRARTRPEWEAWNATQLGTVTTQISLI